MEKTPLIANLVSVQTTTRCTLRCKKCSCSFPLFNPPVDSDVRLIKRSIGRLFNVFSYIHEIRIAGAEAFLYPHVIEVIEETAKHRKKFGYINIVTNATYVPKSEILQSMANLNCPVLVRIDNYGELSGKLTELRAVLGEHKIDYEVRNNCEHNYFCGGWIDFGTEYEDKHYSASELKKLFFNCRNRTECKTVWDGVLYACGFIAAGHKLLKCPVAARDCVDLLNTDNEAAIQKVKDFDKYPLLGCAYCNGFDPVNSPRIPAAEQM
ncbi:MAG: radical SAM protein [Clostridiales Family XIII bacterium]|nr:radical SAM protein [Clostridiales Family XIII bacterium]